MRASLVMSSTRNDASFWRVWPSAATLPWMSISAYFSLDLFFGHTRRGARPLRFVNYLLVL